MPREMLKLRKGDVALKIRSDGTMELAGTSDKPMMDSKGNINPVILFSAAWAKKDPDLMHNLIVNFQNCVREGYFGEEAKRDYEKADKLKQEEEAKKPSAPFLNPEKIEEPVLDPDSKPSVLSLGDEFETSSSKPTVTAPSSNAVGSSSVGDVASGAVTFEQPQPLDTKGHLDRRDS